MDNSLFGYIERLELLAFFSGYPLIYALVILVAGAEEKRNLFKKRLVRLLPYSYATAGVLFLGMILRNNYPDYSLYNMLTGLQEPWLRIWGILSILFFIPFFARKPILSLFHSLVFFYFIVRDLVNYAISGNDDKNVIQNDMKVYADSILLLLAALFVLFVLVLAYDQFRKSRSTFK